MKFSKAALLVIFGFLLAGCTVTLPGGAVETPMVEVAQRHPGALCNELAGNR